MKCKDDEVMVKGACEKVVFYNDQRGHHHGQSDNTLALMTKNSWPVKPGLEEKVIVGYVDYALFENEVHIQMIHVLRPFRRQGWATKMVKYLREQYPNTGVKWGYSTDEGTKFIESLQ